MEGRDGEMSNQRQVVHTYSLIKTTQGLYNLLPLHPIVSLYFDSSLYPSNLAERTSR